MIDKIKLWSVRRWLHLLPYPELRDYTANRGIHLALDKYYEQMAEHLIKAYDSYADTEVITAAKNSPDTTTKAEKNANNPS